MQSSPNRDDKHPWPEDMANWSKRRRQRDRAIAADLEDGD